MKKGNKKHEFGPKFYTKKYFFEAPNHKTKPKQNTTEKHMTKTDPPKPKFAPENIFQTATLRREKLQKRKPRTPNQTQKTKKKKRTAFPLSKRGNHHQTKRNNTVAVFCQLFPSPFWTVLYDCSHERGRRFVYHPQCQKKNPTKKRARKRKKERERGMPPTKSTATQRERRKKITGGALTLGKL